MADVLPPGVDRVDHVGTQHRLHELLAQLQPPAGGQGGRRGQRGGGRLPGGFEAGAAQGGQPAAAGGGRRGGVGAADRAVDHPGLAGGQRDGPLEDVGIVPPAVAPQGGGDMVVDGVAQEDVQLVVFDLAQFGRRPGPQQAVAFPDVGVLQGEEALLRVGVQGGAGAGAPQPDVYRRPPGPVAEDQAVQLGAAGAGAGKGQQAVAGGQRAGQRRPGHGRGFGGGQRQGALPRRAGHREAGRRRAGVAVAHPQPGFFQRRRQGEAVAGGVPRAVRPGAGAGGGGAAEAHPVADGEALHRHFAPTQPVKDQVVVGAGAGEAEFLIVPGLAVGRRRGQPDIRAGDREGPAGGGGVPGAGHVVEHQVLGGVGAVAQLGPDQPGVRPQRRKGDVGIDPVLPFQFMAQGVAGKVGRGGPDMVAAFKGDVGQVHPAAVEAGKDRKVEPHAVAGRRDVGNAAVLFGIRAPGGQGQVVVLWGYSHSGLP